MVKRTESYSIAIYGQGNTLLNYWDTPLKCFARASSMGTQGVRSGACGAECGVEPLVLKFAERSQQ